MKPKKPTPQEPPKKKYACKVYWEQSCEVEIETDQPGRVAELAIEQAEQEIGMLTVRQSKGRKLKLIEICMVPDSVNCDPETDVQPLEED